MAIAASSVTPTNSLEDFRIEFNNLVSDVGGITATNKFTENIIFEGATADPYETTLAVTDPTADRTITLPNLTGTVSLITATETLTNKTINTINATTFTLDASSDIVLDGGGSTPHVIFKDDGTTFGAIAVSGGELAIKSSSSTTTALTFSGANTTAAGTFQATTITATTAVVPDAANGATLGSASLEWSDLYLAEGGVIYFGADQDVTVTHDPDDGLFLKSTATADNNPFLLTLQTGETDMQADDVIGKIAFQAPDEGTGTDAILVSAAIQARSEQDFSASVNKTSIDFMTGESEAATTKMTLSSGGNLNVTGAVTVGTSIVPSSADGATLGSASAEWSDIYLSDAAVIYFGNDQEVKITHDDTDGLTFKCETTDRPFLLTLQSGDTDISDGDVIGRITFQAPDEATGSDANLIAAEIKAVATQDFSASVNKAALLFMTGASEAATEKWRITDTGKLLAAGSTMSLDMNAGEIILDADADTSITADTDDQIDFKISGADDFRMTANTFTVLSGSTLSIPSGATITAASGSTLNGFGTDASATALAIALG